MKVCDDQRDNHISDQACSLVRWDFVHTLKIIARTLIEVVNRERLCVTSAFKLLRFYLEICFFSFRDYFEKGIREVIFLFEIKYLEDQDSMSSAEVVGERSRW